MSTLGIAGSLEKTCADCDTKASYIKGSAGQLGAYTLCRISSFFKKPIFFVVEQMIRSFWVPIMPGEFGQKSAAVEYAYRGSVIAITAAAVLLTSPLPYVLTALAALGVSGTLGIAFKFAASCLNSRDFFSMVQGELKPLEGNQLHVVSANICAFEAGLNWTCGGMRPWQDRIEGIVEALTRPEAQAPHIIALQEVWSQDIALALIEELCKKGYNQFFFSMGLRPHAPGSGLFVASFTKISNPEFVPFKDGRVFDMKRGFFKGEVERKSGESITFVTTHLEPSKDDVNPTGIDKTQRAVQLAQIKKSIGIKKAIICGDLNMRPMELKKLSSAAESETSLFAGDAASPTCALGFDGMLKRNLLVGEMCLDYILTTASLDKTSTRTDCIRPLYHKKEGSDKTEASSLDTNLALSDHQGISTFFTLS